MSLFCATCLKKHIETSERNECPVCIDDSHVLCTGDIKSPEYIHLWLFHGLLVTCKTCSQSFHLSEMTSHQHVCGSSTSCLQPRELTATSILSQPVTSPPSIVEQRVASKIVRRMMLQGGHAQIHTGGQVSKIV